MQSVAIAQLQTYCTGCCPAALVASLQVMQGGVPDVTEMALSALSSIAAAAEQAFQPYTGGQG